jgi:NADH dehydrogenase
LTNHAKPSDSMFGLLSVAPLDFSRPEAMVVALRGVDTLYNTYWVRFPRGAISFERAVAETAVLLAASREAGVRRVVHISVVNADSFGGTAYFRAKAAVERMVAAAGLSHAIVRPTLTVGPGDILINNLAWALRRLPVVGIPGDGRYLVQPVHVEDVARVAIEAGAAVGDLRLDAAGPETFAYRDLVGIIHAAIGSRARVVGMPPVIVAATAHLMGRLVRDVVLTRDEIQELMGGVLVSKGSPTGRVSVADWVVSHSDSLGRHYSSELARNYAQA